MYSTRNSDQHAKSYAKPRQNRGCRHDDVQRKAHCLAQIPIIKVCSTPNQQRHRHIRNCYCPRIKIHHFLFSVIPFRPRTKWAQGLNMLMQIFLLQMCFREQPQTEGEPQCREPLRTLFQPLYHSVQTQWPK